MGTRIFVGNLSFETSEQDLHDLFAGDNRPVEKVSIVTDRGTGRSRGFGFVEMPNANEAKEAITRLNGANLQGRDINVNEARPREERPRGGGGGGGYGGGGGRGGYGGGGGRDRY